MFICFSFHFDFLGNWRPVSTQSQQVDLMATLPGRGKTSLWPCRHHLALCLGTVGGGTNCTVLKWKFTTVLNIVPRKGSGPDTFSSYFACLGQHFCLFKHHIQPASHEHKIEMFFSALQVIYCTLIIVILCVQNQVTNI